MHPTPNWPFALWILTFSYGNPSDIPWMWRQSPWVAAGNSLEFVCECKGTTSRSPKWQLRSLTVIYDHLRSFTGPSSALEPCHADFADLRRIEHLKKRNNRKTFHTDASHRLLYSGAPEIKVVFIWSILKTRFQKYHKNKYNNHQKETTSPFLQNKVYLEKSTAQNLFRAFRAICVRIYFSSFPFLSMFTE